MQPTTLRAPETENFGTVNQLRLDKQAVRDQIVQYAHAAKCLSMPRPVNRVTANLLPILVDQRRNDHVTPGKQCLRISLNRQPDAVSRRVTRPETSLPFPSTMRVRISASSVGLESGVRMAKSMSICRMSGSGIARQVTLARHSAPKDMAAARQQQDQRRALQTLEFHDGIVTAVR